MQSVQFWVGTSGWCYADWAGKFYPATLPRSGWMNYYMTQFNAVEINATFYHTFKDSTYHQWYQQAPAQFRFAIKASRYITHRKYLLDVADPLHKIQHSAQLLKEKLGVILLQLPPNMPYDLERLDKIFTLLSPCDRVAVEFRHQKWLTSETRMLLFKHNAIFCNVDSPDMHISNWLTNHHIGYIRLHGRPIWFASNYNKRQLQRIAEHAHQLIQQGAKEIYIFFNNDVNAYGAFNAQTLLTLL